MEWDPKHFRLFIGDLGNDVNDEDLVKAFGPDKGWKSFVKAKVIRDKVTGKTRGYGFVSYSDPEDFMVSYIASVLFQGFADHITWPIQCSSAI
jgi:RNA recognition motif-containing protein